MGTAQHAARTPAEVPPNALKKHFDHRPVNLATGGLTWSSTPTGKTGYCLSRHHEGALKKLDTKMPIRKQAFIWSEMTTLSAMANLSRHGEVGSMRGIV